MEWQSDDRRKVMCCGGVLVYIAGIHRLREADDAEFEACLRRVPDWRRQRILSYRNRDDRLRSLACSLLLAEGCAKLGWDSQGFIGDNGRPMLSQEGHYISLAHSGDCAAAAFSTEPVGIDVEEIGRFTPERREKIGRKILNDAEKAYLHLLLQERGSLTDCHRNIENADKVEQKDGFEQEDGFESEAAAFARIWTRKEAFVKRSGKGLSMDFWTIDTMQEDMFYSCTLEKDYIMSVCGLRSVEMKIVISI